MEVRWLQGWEKGALWWEEKGRKKKFESRPSPLLAGISGSSKFHRKLLGKRTREEEINFSFSNLHPLGLVCAVALQAKKHEIPDVDSVSSRKVQFFLFVRGWLHLKCAFHEDLVTRPNTASSIINRRPPPSGLLSPPHQWQCSEEAITVGVGRSLPPGHKKGVSAPHAK